MPERLNVSRLQFQLERGYITRQEWEERMIELALYHVIPSVDGGYYYWHPLMDEIIWVAQIDWVAQMILNSR